MAWDWIFRLDDILPPKPDPRVLSYPLMESWTPTALIALAYVVWVCAWRSELTKRCKLKQRVTPTLKPTSSTIDRPSVGWDTLKCLIILYNGTMVFYSAYMSISAIIHIRRLGYTMGCVGVPDINDRQTDHLVLLGYLFYFSKFLEMLDTIFFLIRGKVDQVTFLHVFHHAAMPPSIWWGLKYAPGGMPWSFLVVNSFIHVIMYTYYGLAAAGLHKYLWWKNYLTLAQMVQFVFLILHQGQVFIWPCDYPKVFPAAIVFYATVFLILFGNFYIQAYWRKRRPAKRHDDVGQVSKDVTSNGHVSNGHVSNGYLPTNPTYKRVGVRNVD